MGKKHTTIAREKEDIDRGAIKEDEAHDKGQSFSLPAIHIQSHISGG